MTHTRVLRYRQMTVRCTWCRAAAGELCTNQRGDKQRRDGVHEARIHTWVISKSTCPTCTATPGKPCIGPDRLPAKAPHPARTTLAHDTQDPP